MVHSILVKSLSPNEGVCVRLGLVSAPQFGDGWSPIEGALFSQSELAINGWVISLRASSSL